MEQYIILAEEQSVLSFTDITALVVEMLDHRAANKVASTSIHEFVAMLKNSPFWSLLINKIGIKEASYLDGPHRQVQGYGISLNYKEQ